MTTPQKLSAVSVAVASVLFTALPVYAQSLVELYDSARAFDANYQSAKLQYDANLAKAEQAKAGILPTAGLSVGATRNNLENTNPALTGLNRTFSSQTAALTASQPLYRPGNLAHKMWSRSRSGAVTSPVNNRLWPSPN